MLKKIQRKTKKKSFILSVCCRFVVGVSASVCQGDLNFFLLKRAQNKIREAEALKTFASLLN